MKEVTRIITLEITHIECIPDDMENLIYESSRSLENFREPDEEIKELLGVDDVKTIKVQDFILDVEEGEHERSEEEC